MSFIFQKLKIPDVLLIEPRSYIDERGFFAETYKRSEFIENGIKEEFVQDNLSHSSKGTLRGLHFQNPPKAQAKLVMVLKGEVFDAAIDIRKNSPTYGQYIGLTLSDKKIQMLYIPIGFAHGFCVLSDEADFFYKVSDEYAPILDSGIRWNDPDIGIQWPISEPILSERDAELPLLEQANLNFA
ncbi:MAG: dTDP-4-dehydrorhamnose 3,5-epimerase [bacterium]|nr:MAG: dTDP-4-dehydrorhamnose 3,5-epimerase [bacterium]